jgi:hypothetical protein
MVATCPPNYRGILPDREDTIKTSLISECALMLARLWKQHLRPVDYNRVFYVDGIRVEVSISEIDQTPPKRRESDIEKQMSDRSTDA